MPSFDPGWKFKTRDIAAQGDRIADPDVQALVSSARDRTVDTLIRDFADVPTDDPPTRLMLVNWLEFQPQLWTELAQRRCHPRTNYGSAHRNAPSPRCKRGTQRLH